MSPVTYVQCVASGKIKTRQQYQLIKRLYDSSFIKMKQVDFIIFSH